MKISKSLMPKPAKPAKPPGFGMLKRFRRCFGEASQIYRKPAKQPPDLIAEVSQVLQGLVEGVEKISTKTPTTAEGIKNVKSPEIVSPSTCVALVSGGPQ